ncbi:MAG: SsrA-binding protein SmpB [Candidatus Campbellbacteria bacterium]|nr:SsrA-binding protein SmpB [Candidatus Campbellbacteria bacterium]
MTLIHNKKALRDYEVIDKFEAGIELFGFEVKSLRSGQGSLAGSYVTVNPFGAILQKANIPPFQAQNVSEDYDPERPRRLLFHKKELVSLSQKLGTPGLTLIPISLYNRRGLIKVDVALARGRKKHDKREQIKKRDEERNIEREIKQNVRF